MTVTKRDSSSAAKFSPEDIEEAARRLRAASESGIAVQPVRDLLPGASIEDAYSVQWMNSEIEVTQGRRPMGWKIGLTSQVVQRQLGVNQPDFGILFSDACVGDGQPVDSRRLLQPRVEAEVAFVLERDLPAKQICGVDILRSTGFVLPAIEIVDSRIADWDIDIVDTIADNASSGMFVLGLRPVGLGDVDLRAASMRLTAGGEVVSEGSGAACLGHPVNAVVWLANTLAELDQPLRAGDVVLSGALGPMCSVERGVIYEAVIAGLGSVRADFSQEA